MANHRRQVNNVLVDSVGVGQGQCDVSCASIVLSSTASSTTKYIWTGDRRWGFGCSVGSPMRSARSRDDLCWREGPRQVSVAMRRRERRWGCRNRPGVGGSG